MAFLRKGRKGTYLINSFVAFTYFLIKALINRNFSLIFTLIIFMWSNFDQDTYIQHLHA
jgi:hypothetical protein